MTVIYFDKTGQITMIGKEGISTDRFISVTDDVVESFLNGRANPGNWSVDWDSQAEEFRLVERNILKANRRFTDTYHMVPLHQSLSVSDPDISIEIRVGPSVRSEDLNATVQILHWKIISGDLPYEVWMSLPKPILITSYEGGHAPHVNEKGSANFPINRLDIEVASVWLYSPYRLCKLTMQWRGCCPNIRCSF